MKIPKPIALLFLTAAALSTLPMARAQTPPDEPNTPAELPPGVIHMTCVPSAPDPALVQAGQNAYDAIAHGDVLLKKGQTEAAIRCYKNAMTYEPDNASALQSLAEAYALTNRLGEAGKTYHHLFYEARWESVGGNPCVYLGYALVLAKTGQGREAVKFYQEGAHLLNYEDDKPNLKVMLPTFGNGEGQASYTPELLQAMAHVGLAVYSQDDKEKLAHLDAAIKLQPDMPQAYFYKGQTLWGKPHRSREALAAYLTARQMTDVDTQLMIDKVIKDTDVEKGAALEQARENQAALKQAREKQKAGPVPGSGATTGR